MSTWIDWAQRELTPYKTPRRSSTVTVSEAVRLLGCTYDFVLHSGEVPIEMDRRGHWVVPVKPLWVLALNRAAAQVEPRGFTRAELHSLTGVSVVYFIQGGGLCKIGTTTNIVNRLAHMQLGSPSTLQVVHLTPGGVAEERQFHEAFADSRRHGEWFALDPREIEIISANHQIPDPIRSERRRVIAEHRIICPCGKECRSPKGYDQHRRARHPESLEAA